MNKILCPLCNGSSLQLITDKVRFGKRAEVYKCQGCGLCFINQASFSFPGDFYEKEYHQTYLTHVEPAALNPQLYYEKMKVSSKIWADKFRTMLSGRETVLDSGCSTGHFIDLVKDKTSKIYGYDLNKKEVDFCRDVLKLDVSCQPLKERFKEGTFDYITMIYVLEHIARPIEFLNSLKKFLKPQGKFVILVPNAQDALLNLYGIPQFREFYYCIEHLFYYTPKTIRGLFEAVGLRAEVEPIQEYPLSNHLNWAYRCAPSDTLASRKGVPDIALSNAVPIEHWNGLWDKLNQLYHSFLKEHGFADRIWCTVGV